jgi:hypothetical protein
MYFKRIASGQRFGDSFISQRMWSGSPQIVPGFDQRVPVCLEEIFDHLPLQNVFEYLWRYFSRNQTLF